MIMINADKSSLSKTSASREAAIDVYCADTRLFGMVYNLISVDRPHRK